MSERDFRNEPWIRDGNSIRTLEIQPETGLPFSKNCYLASVDLCQDEEGRSLYPHQRIQIADLMAAAPELLSALIIAHSALEEVTSSLVGVVRAEQLAKQAIRKARGEITSQHKKENHNGSK